MSDKELRNMLIKMLRDPNAHLMIEEILDGFPQQHYGTIPEGFAHSAWELIEHLRIDINDTIEFTIKPDYKPKKFPDDFWPEKVAPEDQSQWELSVAGFKESLNRLISLIEDANNDLFKALPNRGAQNLLACAMLMMKHNSYHLGQLMTLRRYLEQKG